MRDLARQVCIGILVGSPRSKICSIGKFAQKQYEDLKSRNIDCFLDLPEGPENKYPSHPNRQDATHIFWHLPSLYERRSPCHFIISLVKIFLFYPFAKIIVELHEYTEAPWHWKFRVKLLSFFIDCFVVNTKSDQLLVSKFSKRVIRSQLAPTLCINPDQARDLRSLKNFIDHARSEIFFKISHARDKILITLPGMITPGKGIELLIDWAKNQDNFPKNCALLLMGGTGPKTKDQTYSYWVQNQMAGLKNKGFCAIIYPNASDEDYINALLASNLVVLPFQEGVSERRSTFLSACACAANVWTTLGRYSDELELDHSGVFSIHNTVPNDEKERSLTQALAASLDIYSEQILKKRLTNLAWAQKKTWYKRTDETLQLIKHIE